MKNKSLFRSLARLWVRGGGPKDGVILGVTFKGTRNVLKANHVYELREVMGEVILKDLGPSWLGNKPKDPAYGRTIGDVFDISGKYFGLTKEEYIEQRKKENPNYEG
jgi:hypothetical protein